MTLQLQSLYSPETDILAAIVAYISECYVDFYLLLSFLFYLDAWELYIPEPPDGGWGWVILVASFILNFIVDGTAYCFGVFLMEYARGFDATVGATSLSNSLLCGIYLLIGTYLPDGTGV